MRNVLHLAAIALTAAVLLIPLHCVDTGGNTSEVGNPGIVGGLIDGRAGKPAANALVRLYGSSGAGTAKAIAAPLRAVALDSVTTDRTGRYRFDSLPEGVYAIKGELVDNGDTLYMNRLTVIYTDSRSIKDLGWDTLRLPGAIGGRVRADGESVLGVVCYIPGTSFAAYSDSAGAFLITGVPEGMYTVAFKSERYFDSTIAGVRVRAATTTDIGEVRLRVDRSKNEHDVWGVFDSSYQAIGRIEARVTGDSIPALSPRVYPLDWRRDVAGYSGFIYVPSSGLFWTVSIWVYDTLGARIGVSKVLINRSTGDIEVPRFNPCNAIPVISLEDTIVSVNDTLHLAPRISLLADDSIVSMAWKIADSGAFVATTRSDTVLCMPADSTLLAGTFMVQSAFGAVAQRRIAITVARDAPSFTLGNDQTRLLGSNVAFTVEPVQRFGSIVMYVWEFHVGDTTRVDSGATLRGHRFTLGVPGETMIVCRLRDDDGNVAADTVLILVVSELSGVIDSNVTLLRIGSPYLVSNALVVPGRLSIEPGTVVQLNVGASMTVYGTLEMNGVDANRITLMDNSADSANGRWGMVRIMAGATVRMRYSDLRNIMIASEDAANPAEVSIDQSQIVNTALRINSPSGQRVVGSITGSRIVQSDIDIACDKWLFTGNSFVRDRGANAASCRLSLRGRDLVVSGNRFTNVGFRVEGNGEITNDTVEGAFYDAISVVATSGGAWKIASNLISGNGGSGIFAMNVQSQPAIGNRITRNTIIGNGYGEPPVVYPFFNAGIICLDSLAVIDSNTITDNTVGVTCRGNAVMRFNNCFANRTYDYRVPIGDSSRVDLSNNWWGTVDTAQIKRKIYNPGVAEVVIDPVAIDSIPVAGEPLFVKAKPATR